MNPRAGGPGSGILPDEGFEEARREIASWSGYAATPLRDLPALAQQTGLAAIRLKDEAGRFGLGSFKALGGAYAIAQMMATVPPHRRAGITVTSATDGNHGRSVASGAARFGCRCVIFVHPGVSQSRIDAIARFGAEVRVVPGTYDDSVRAAAREAAEHGWHVISDTSWPGYTEIPRAVMQGYRVMADEAVAQWDGPPPTHVFIQGGVGGVAAAVSAHLRTRFDPAPALIVVEPERAACLFASAEEGALTVIGGDLATVMAGLSCGEPSPLAWAELERGATAFLAIPDAAAIGCLRLLARQGIESGESGVAGLAGCLLASSDPATRLALGLTENSRVLAFSTEGATDPELYRRLISDQRG